MTNTPTPSSSGDRQTTFSGEEIDAELFSLRREFFKAFGILYEAAADLISNTAVLSDFQRIMAVENVTEVDPFFFADSERRMAFLWTAECAGQTGQRAADLAFVHLETSGEIESHFYKDAYAAEAFDEFAHPDEWEWGPRLYAEAGNPGDTVLNAFVVEGDAVREVMIDDFGYTSSADYYAWTEGCYEFQVLDPDDHPVQVIHHDMMHEHTDPLTIASDEGVFKFESRGGVMWDSHLGDCAPEWAWDLAAEKYRGDGLSEGWSSVSTGWHSSLERSDLSDLINDITRGDFHETATADIPPVMVAFSGTGNICSVGLSVYTHDEFAEELKEILSGKRAAPGYAGVN